jgi:hypothetical protein
VVTWLERQIGQGGQLTCGIPQDPDQRVTRWIGRRLFWWPRGIPSQQRLGVVSSRLGRPPYKHRDWFAALQCLCRDLVPRQMILVTAAGTTTCRYLTRCSELFQLPLLRCDLPPDRQGATDWFRAICDTDSQAVCTEPLVWPVAVSPPLDVDPSLSVPLRDRLIMAACNPVVVLRVRRGGHVWELAMRRLSEDADAARQSLQIVVGHDLVPDKLAQELVEHGAELRPWRKPGDVTPRGPHTRANMSLDLSTACPVPYTLPESGYLTHCTRAAPGPWPDETWDDYLDALIMGSDESDHGALATLARIAGSQKLVASSLAIRGAVPVVCFTAIPLREIAQQRVFRAHRGRWDFEPYGICLKQSWLEQRGARPVVYAEPSAWETLSESLRPFYQRGEAGRHQPIDWRVEREWRHVGDLDLSCLPHHAAFLFVPTEQEALWLRRRSRWPVVVLPNDIGNV